MLRSYQKIKRRKTRVVNVGNILIGGDNPITVQTMTNTLTSDILSTSKQIDRVTNAGADIVTVLGLASTKTLNGVKQAAVKNEKEVMVDMINHPCPENKWNELKNMEMSLCCLHTANDDSKDGETPLNDLERFYNLHGGKNIAVAGGINPDMIRKINIFHPEIVIVGGYIANSRNQRDALVEIHQAMDSR